MNAIRSRAHPVRRLLTNARTRARRLGRMARHLRLSPPRLGGLAPLRPSPVPVPVPVRTGVPVRNYQRPPVRW